MLKKLLISIAVTITQAATFLLSWKILVEIGFHFGRSYRESIAFGITIEFGLYLFTFLAFVGNCLKISLKLRWIFIAFCVVSLMVWMAWTLPSTVLYPVRGAAYACLGTLIYVAGIIFCNIINEHVKRANNTHQKTLRP